MTCDAPSWSCSGGRGVEVRELLGFCGQRGRDFAHGTSSLEVGIAHAAVASKRSIARPTATSPSLGGRPSHRATLRSSACAHTAPNTRRSRPIDCDRLVPHCVRGQRRSKALAAIGRARGVRVLAMTLWGRIAIWIRLLRGSRRSVRQGSVEVDRGVCAVADGLFEECPQRHIASGRGARSRARPAPSGVTGPETM